MLCRTFAALILALSVFSADGIPDADQLHLAGALRGDRTKLWEAWRRLPTPQVAATLTDAWAFEAEVNRDEELVGLPPFLQVLADWEQKEPDNALAPCLRELFHSLRDSRFPDWERLDEAISWKRHIYFHYGDVRRRTLGFVLERRGNTVDSWVSWLRHPPLQNPQRVALLVQLALLEERFLLLSGHITEARARLDAAWTIASLMAGDDDEIAVRRATLQGGVLQEEILYALVTGDYAAVEPLIEKYRGLLAEQTALVSRLSVLSELHTNLSDASDLAYADIRTVSWNDVQCTDPAVMQRFSAALQADGSRAVDDFWRYRKVPEDDFSRVLEQYLEVFQEAELTRATAAGFMDYLRANLSEERGMPTWIIPAFARVIGAYRNAPALGRTQLQDPLAEEFRWLAGALGFLAGPGEDPQRWISAFKAGKARPYLLLAFVKWHVAAAVPAVAEEFRALAERAPAGALIDYALCLRFLTNQDFGLDAGKWYDWCKANEERFTAPKSAAF